MKTIKETLKDKDGICRVNSLCPTTRKLFNKEFEGFCTYCKTHTMDDVRDNKEFMKAYIQHKLKRM